MAKKRAPESEPLWDRRPRAEAPADSGPPKDAAPEKGPATAHDKTLYIIDGTAYIYRAFHAIRGLSNSRGMPTNAAFGFARMIKALLAEKQPAHIAVAFDAKGPTFRHEMYDEYKANRPPMDPDMAVQIPYIRDIAKGFGLPVLEMPGYEADDVIGTLARAAEKDGFSVVMVTGDKDFLQLVTEKTVILDPMKNKTIDLEAATAVHGLAPGQIVDAMGFAGDTSDNVPGVPGVGMKTAAKLVNEHGDMEGVYAALDSIKGKKLKENLIAFKDQAFLSRDLVRIRTDAPVDAAFSGLAAGEPDPEALVALFTELDFGQLLEEFRGSSDLSDKDYRAVLAEKDLESLLQKLLKAGRFSLDTETTSENPMKAELVGLSFSTKPHEAFYIPVAHAYEGAPEQLGREAVLKALAPVLSDPDLKKIGQNIKYDWTVLERHGATLKGVAFDTMLASYLVDPSKRSHGLDRIALDFLGHSTTSFEEVAGKGKNAKTFDQVGLDAAVPYACEDADITLMAEKVLSKKMAEMGLAELFETVEMPLLRVLMKMEQTGMCVDRERLETLSKTFADDLEQVEAEIYRVAGEEFNIKSSQQLGGILFEKLNLPVQKKTKKTKGYSTDVEVLTTLAPMHELPALVLRHRTIAKLKSTYVDALIGLIHPETGRVHTSFNQTVAATGRLSSSDPNLQNIPIRTEEGLAIRSAFVPRKGWELISADYSQIELRIFAHCSEDPILIEAFENNQDIHSRTAAEVFGVDPEDVSPDLRRQAKAINFGIIYGMSAFGLARELSISQAMARTYIDHYFKRYAGVKRYIDEVIETARRDEAIRTLLGRVRPLPDINAKNATQRGFAERTAVNTPIQGTAADIIKMAMIQVDAALAEKGLSAALLLSVHDELVLEAPTEEREAVTALVLQEMEGIMKLKVPLKVNAAWGKNWAEAH